MWVSAFTKVPGGIWGELQTERGASAYVDSWTLRSSHLAASSPCAFPICVEGEPVAPFSDAQALCSFLAQTSPTEQGTMRGTEPLSQRYFSSLLTLILTGLHKLFSQLWHRDSNPFHQQSS